jgi:hypothetical protein
VYLGITSGCRIEPKILRNRKRPKATSINAKIVREPFGDESIKLLPIPVFIDDYNHYINGVDRANQLRSSFTIHFKRNQKEFFPGVFFSLDLAAKNSYKLNLALNGVKNTSNDKIYPRQHRKWMEELVNLLFQVDSDDFGEEIYFKPYPKYVYESPKIGPKIDRKEAFFKAINGASTEYLYSLNPLNKRNFCYFC